MRPPRAPFAALALAALALAGAGCAGPAVPRETADPTPVDADLAATTITAEDMHARIAALAHDSMMGRDTPSPGLESAARYLAAGFASFGLEPAGDDGSYLQRYPLASRALDTASVHFGTVNRAGEDNRMLRHGVDFFAAPAAPREGVDMYHGRFAWVGRRDGRPLPAADYAGKIVVVDLPGAFDREWRIGASRARREAQEAGATALLVVLGPEFPAEVVAARTQAHARPDRSLPDPDEIPVFFVTREAARAIVRREGVELEALPAAPGEPIVFENVRAHFAAEARTVEQARPANVAAILRGSDPALADTYVVLTAHYDHVGIGPADAAGDSIYNGADDDASGTAALLEVAEAFSRLDEAPARSILFLAVSGEEKGLLGSRWFTDHPTVPLGSIVADLNADMVGRNDPAEIVVIGQEYSSLGPLVRGTAASHPELGLSVLVDPWPEERFFFRSDHFNFVRREIPALFFFSGVHEDYHRPSDEVERIDADKAARVARLIFRTARAIAESPERPRWTEEGLAEVRALTR